MNSCSREKMERVDAAMDQPLLRRNLQIQPGSVVGSLISGSNGSNPTKQWKYQAKAFNSGMDESLFGVKDEVNEQKRFMSYKEIVHKRNAKISDLVEAAQRKGQVMLERIRTRCMEQEAQTKELIEARDAEIEEEKEKRKKEKEKEVARLRAVQERATNYQAEQDALKANSKQEAMDKTWCQKERELARKDVETIAKQKQSRLALVGHKQHFLAVQAKRERAEIERVLRPQRGQLQKERKEQEEKTTLRMKHQTGLRRQVREEEQKHRSNR